MSRRKRRSKLLQVPAVLMEWIPVQEERVPTVYSSDRRIDSYIEEKRREFYEEWFEYLYEWEHGE